MAGTTPPSRPRLPPSTEVLVRPGEEYHAAAWTRGARHGMLHTERAQTHLDPATAHRPARSADPAVVVGRRRHLHRPGPDRRLPPRLRRGQPARLARARAGRGGRGRRDRASGRGRLARSGAANRGRVVRPDPVGPVPVGVPRRRGRRDRQGARGGDECRSRRGRSPTPGLAGPRRDPRELPAGVPDSTTILPISDLEERIDRTADRQLVEAEPVAIPIEPEPVAAVAGAVRRTGSRHGAPRHRAARETRGHWRWRPRRPGPMSGAARTARSRSPTASPRGSAVPTACATRSPRRSWPTTRSSARSCSRGASQIRGRPPPAGCSTAPPARRRRRCRGPTRIAPRRSMPRSTP